MLFGTSTAERPTLAAPAGGSRASCTVRAPTRTCKKKRRDRGNEQQRTQHHNNTHTHNTTQHKTQHNNEQHDKSETHCRSTPCMNMTRKIGINTLCGRILLATVVTSIQLYQSLILGSRRTGGPSSANAMYPSNRENIGSCCCALPKKTHITLGDPSPDLWTRDPISTPNQLPFFSKRHRDASVQQQAACSKQHCCLLVLAVLVVAVLVVAVLVLAVLVVAVLCLLYWCLLCWCHCWVTAACAGCCCCRTDLLFCSVVGRAGVHQGQSSLVL